jgi:hypothetical protein
MGLLPSISNALEERKRRRQETQDRKEQVERERAKRQRRDDRAQARSPFDVATLIAADDFESRSAARRIPMAIRSPLAGADSSGLAAEIAQLSVEDRYLLALAADGWTTEEIASWHFRDPQSVRLDLRRIYIALGR